MLALAADGTLAREACMAHFIAGAAGRVVAITGGFHTVALPDTKPEAPKAVKLGRSADAGVTLMRYNFEQLDSLNGYSSGMPSPEFYQRVWTGADAATTLVALARDLREERGDPSAAEVITATAQMERLARLRGHARPTREDLFDAVRSVFVKGSADVEGVRIMAGARRFFAGDRRGRVPGDAGRPPLVLDFEAQAERLRVQLDGSRERELVLDIYRSARHRTASRLLHSVSLLEVPFARKVRGPDFVHAEGLERIQEVWRYQWQPSVEGSLIEAVTDDLVLLAERGLGAGVDVQQWNAQRARVDAAGLGVLSSALGRVTREDGGSLLAAAYIADLTRTALAVGQAVAQMEETPGAGLRAGASARHK